MGTLTKFNATRCKDHGLLKKIFTTDVHLHPSCYLASRRKIISNIYNCLVGSSTLVITLVQLLL